MPAGIKGVLAAFSLLMRLITLTIPDLPICTKISKVAGMKPEQVVLHRTLILSGG